MAEDLSDKKNRQVQWFIAGATMVASAVAVVVLVRSCGVGTALSAERRAKLGERLRLAAIDGTISVAERQAIDSWLGSDAARESAKDYQAAIEASLVAAAKATAEAVEHNGQGRRTEAVKKFHEALRHDPDFLEAALNLGAAELDAKEFDAATRRLEGVLTKIGNPSKVESSAKDAFEIQLDEARARQRFFAHYNLAGCYAGRRPTELDTSLEHLEAALGAFRTWKKPSMPVSRIVKDLEKSLHFQSLAGNPRFEAVVGSFRALVGVQR